MSDRYVYDGDTYYQDGDAIRLYGVNTPERKPNEAGWRQARDALELGLEAGYTPGDKVKGSYDRAVRPLEPPTGGPTLDAEMVADGLGFPLSDRVAKGSTDAVYMRGAQKALGIRPTGVAATYDWQALAESARRERLTALAEASASGALRRALNAPTNLRDPHDRNFLARAWDRGVDNMQGTFYGFVNAIGELTGSDALAEWGEEGLAQNIIEAMQNPAKVETWDDVHSLTDAGIYALEALAEFSPQLATDALAFFASGGTAALLAGAGKAFLRKVGGSLAVGEAGKLAGAGWARTAFVQGGKGGVLASLYAQSSGETQMNFLLEGIDNPGFALGVGAAKAALDYYGLDKVLGSVVKGLSSKTAPEKVTELLGNALKATAVGFTAESLTEATQALMDELAIKDQKPEHQINLANVREALIKGGIVGGGLAGAGRVMADTSRMMGEVARIPGAGDPPQPTAPEPEADIRAQLANTPAGEGNWYTAENAEPAKAVAAEMGKATRELEDGSVGIGTPEVLAELPERPTQADLARLSGYAQTKDEAMADPQGVVAVETRDATGAVLRNQVVGRSIAEAVARQQAEKFPGARVAITTPEAMLIDRAAAVAQERQPAPPPKGTLTADDELIREARELGVDLTRFQKTGLGRAVLKRLVGGLQARVEGGGKRLDAVPSLASLLDMPVQELHREYYDSRNVIRGRDELLNAIRRRAIERLGSWETLADTIDQLPRSQAEAIRNELGLREEGGYDIGRLMSEVQARRSDPHAAVLPPPNPGPHRRTEPTGRVMVTADLVQMENGRPRTLRQRKVVPEDQVEATRQQLLAELPGATITTAPMLRYVEEQPAEPVAEAKRPEPDKVRDAVFGTPAIRQLLVNDAGQPASPDEIDRNIERLSKGERLRLEESLKRLDIDIGGQNRQLFLDLLRESVVGEPTYGIGSVYADDEVSGDEGGGARIVVPTQEFNPSLLDDENSRFYQLVDKTPLTDRTRSGWPAGLSLYLEAMSRIIRAGEAEAESALSRQEAVRLSQARGLALVLTELVRRDGLLDLDTLLTHMAERLGISEELVQRAAGTQKARLLPALQALSRGMDRRMVEPLTRQLVRIVNTDPSGFAWDEYDFEALPTSRDDEAMLADLMAQLRSDPQAGVYALADAIMDLTGAEPLDTLGIIADHHAAQDRPVTANVPARAAAQGENVAVVGSLPFNEQFLSDSTFFAAVRRASVQDWEIAELPAPDEVPHLAFGNPVSQLLTRRFKGKNLLPLPSANHPFVGSVVDAIALAAYAQSGEPVPATPGQAASNLLANIARLYRGAQNSHSHFGDRPKAVVRTIPDNLVIFVDPVTGRGVTFGEALNHRHAVADARARLLQIQREMDKTSDSLDELADTLGLFAAELRERTAEVRRSQPIAEQAVTRWLDVLAGKPDRHGRRARRATLWREDIPSDAAAYLRELKEGDEKLARAMNAIGRMKVDEDGRTLDEVFGEYLGLLGQMRRLAQEKAELRGFDGVVGDVPDQEDIVADKIDPDGTLSDAQRARRVEQASRGGQGTAVLAGDPDSVDTPRGEVAFLQDMAEREQPDYNPYAYDPLHALSEQAWMDAEDLAQEQAIRALLAAREQGRLAPAMEEKPGTERPTTRPVSVPLFRLASTVTGSKPAKGMSREAVEAVVAQFQAYYKGHLPLVFRIAATQEEVYGTLPEGLVVKGAYHSTGGRGPAATAPVLQPGLAGRVVLVAENLQDETDVLETLRHEVLGHFGLNTFTPDVKRAILAAVEQSRAVPGMRSIWKLIDRRYADMDGTYRAEEVFAYIAEQERAGLAALYDRIAALVAQGLRRIGLLQGQVTRAELAVLVRQIGAGIRDGHRRQRTFPRTDLDQFRRVLPGETLLRARARQFWNKGTIPAYSSLFSMVHTRIARYHEALARALFQPAGAEASVLGQSWEQRNRALKGRMMAQLDRVLTDLRRGKRGARARAVVQAAFEDAYSGNPQTPQGKRIRTLVDQLVAEARNAGLRSIRLPENFAPIAFDRRVVAMRAAEFQRMLTDAGIAPGEARELYSRIVDGPGVIEGAFAPGMPVGTHATTRTLVEMIGQDKLLLGGWLLRRHDAALIHWIDGVSKRAAWEGLFGAEVEGIRYDVSANGVVANFDPSARYKAMLDQVRRQHGEPAVKEIIALVNGALGRHPVGQGMPGWWRTTQDFIVGWVGMTVLAFSGIASIPELALPLLRANGRVNLTTLFTDYASARRFARDMGIVLSDASEQVMWQASGDQYRSPLINRMQSLFFKLNGNTLLCNTTRTLATGVAIRYLLAAAADRDEGALGRLNIDAGTIHAWDQLGRPAWSPDLPDDQRLITARVSDAVHQFVNEATLNPSRFQATHWGNNPYLKTIWHLKHFLYAYGDTVLLGMWREMRRRWHNLDPRQFNHAVAIATPALLFAFLVMPLAAAALEARDWVRRLNGQKSKEYADAWEYFRAVFDRAGGLGPVDFLFQMRQQQEWGASIFGSLGPVPAKIDMLFGDGRLEAILRQVTPIWSQNRTLFGFLD